jgi:DNA-binding transcriptional LysR family regulator
MIPDHRQRRNASLIRGLQCFEAVARRGSVTAAAEELGVSQSAISHQLRDLTRALGEQLLVRSGRGLAVTSAGQRLSERLSATFANLEASLEDIVGGSGQVFRVAVCSSFGPGWLIPRLESFIGANPGIALQLNLHVRDPHFSHEVADVIFSALPVAPGFAAVHIFDEMLVAVHAPGSPSNRLRLITTELDEQRIGQDWTDYCRRAGLACEDLQEGAWLRCTHFLFALEMARAGLGAALVPEFLARRHIEDGSLVYLNRLPMPSGRVYRLCYKQSRAKEIAITAFSRWLRAELSPIPRSRPYAHSFQGIEKN